MGEKFLKEMPLTSLGNRTPNYPFISSSLSSLFFPSTNQQHPISKSPLPIFLLSSSLTLPSLLLSPARAATEGGRDDSRKGDSLSGSRKGGGRRPGCQRRRASSTRTRARLARATRRGREGDLIKVTVARGGCR